MEYVGVHAAAVRICEVVLDAAPLALEGRALDIGLPEIEVGRVPDVAEQRDRAAVAVPAGRAVVRERRVVEVQRRAQRVHCAALGEGDAAAHRHVHEHDGYKTVTKSTIGLRPTGRHKRG